MWNWCFSVACLAVIFFFSNKGVRDNTEVFPSVCTYFVFQCCSFWRVVRCGVPYSKQQCSEHHRTLRWRARNPVQVDRAQGVEGEDNHLLPQAGEVVLLDEGKHSVSREGVPGQSLLCKGARLQNCDRLGHWYLPRSQCMRTGAGTEFIKSKHYVTEQ